jgi:hypothetical protein
VVGHLERCSTDHAATEPASWIPAQAPRLSHEVPPQVDRPAFRHDSKQATWIHWSTRGQWPLTHRKRRGHHPSMPDRPARSDAPMTGEAPPSGSAPGPKREPEPSGLVAVTPSSLRPECEEDDDASHGDGGGGQSEPCGTAHASREPVQSYARPSTTWR